MAVGNPILKSFIAGADLSSYQYCCVKVHTTDGQVVLADTAGEHCVGILQNTPASGEEAVVAIAGSCKAKANGAVAVNELLETCNTTGRVDTETTANFHIGVALDTATATGDIIEIIVAQGDSAVT